MSFVKVTKAGRVLEVHPDSLKMHLGLGWVQVPDDGKVARYSEEDLQARVEEAVRKALEERGEQNPPPESPSPEGGKEAAKEPQKKGKGK